MILTIDVGNTHTIIGVYNNDELVFTARISTDRQKTRDEYSIIIRSVLSLSDKVSGDIEGAIISSVVFLHERMTLLSLIGAVLILASTLYSSIERKRLFKND